MPPFALFFLSVLSTAASLPHRRATSNFTYPTFASQNASGFRVTTSSLPLFNGIDVQDSWAGRVDPASTPGTGLFFWYFPSSQTGGSETLTIWLNGGPGCTSMEGATQENGAFVLAAGASNPVVNPNGWTTVSDMLYIDQPAGVGFSTGSDSMLTGELPLADAFYIFLQAFFNVFPELVTKKLYVAGESYAGYYIPYIASRILSASATEKATLPLRLQGIIINDGVYSDMVVGQQAPVARFATAHAATLGFDSTFVAQLKASSTACGYEKLIDSVQYPQPSGPITLPQIPDEITASYTLTNECDLFSRFYDEAIKKNACFDIYRITDVCPTPADLIGDGTYFSRSDVQSALHVPNSGNWTECAADPFVQGQDVSAFSQTLFPSILAQIPVLLWHGQIDAILFTAGDFVTIQNTTWNGVQGFTSAPNLTLTLNSKAAGTWGTERNLTFITVNNAGHMIPQDQPALALAIFTLFLKTGAVGNGALTSTTGEFASSGSSSGTSTSSTGAAGATKASAAGLARDASSGWVVGAVLAGLLLKHLL